MENHALSTKRMHCLVMMDQFELPEHDDEDIDIYEALGLNNPVQTEGSAALVYDPLAAFMDDDEREVIRISVSLDLDAFHVHPSPSQ